MRSVVSHWICSSGSPSVSAASFATTEAPPRPLSRRGRIPGCVYQPELVTLALCLRAKASPFWIMLLLVLGLRDHQVIQHCYDPPHSAPPCANRLSAFGDIRAFECASLGRYDALS